MNTLDKVSKETIVLVDSVKDLISANLLVATRTKNVVVDESQLARLISVVENSADEAFQRALPRFQKTVESLLEAPVSSSKKK